MQTTSVRRGSRRSQPTWVWIATLTANGGNCVYCDAAEATTLDHDEPIGDDGADIWWNFAPACKPCNDWKGKRTATEWLRDQKLHREHPKVGFDTRMMPVRMVSGFKTRLDRVKRELLDPDRRTWFQRHYGFKRHKNKTEMRVHLEACRTRLSGFPNRPWETPNVRESDIVCTRRMCCGWRHLDAASIDTVILARDARIAFKQQAFEARMTEGDLAAKLIIEYLGRHKISPCEAHGPT